MRVSVGESEALIAAAHVLRTLAGNERFDTVVNLDPSP